MGKYIRKPKKDFVPADAIKRVRLSCGLSQEQAAAVLKRSRPCWNAWERGRNPMHIHHWNEFVKRTQRNLKIKIEKVKFMTPQEALEKQYSFTILDSGSNPPICTAAEISHFTANKSIFEETKKVAVDLLTEMHRECRIKHARKLFGENGSMIDRNDPEANAWRSAIRDLVKYW